MLRGVVLTGLVGLLSLVTSVNHASAVDRRGFLIGLGYGVGNMMFGETNQLDGTGPSVEFHLGGMLSDRTALMFDDYGIVQSFSNGATLSAVLGTVSVQHWVGPRVWLKGGGGLGGLQVDSGNLSISSDPGFGFLLGGGVEVIQRTKFVLDAQARLSSMWVDSEAVRNLAVVVGVNWY